MQAHTQDQLVRGVGWFGIGIGLGAAVARFAATRGRRHVTIKTSVTIRKEPAEVYQFWRNFANLPQFMRHLSSVSETSNGHLRWRGKGPAGASLTWEAEIVADRTNERIAWRSLEGSMLPNHGSVLLRRAPQDRGTEVHLTVGFEPPGGVLAAKVVRLFEGIPEQQLKNDLRRLKQILETGDVVRSDSSIHPGLHAARPASAKELSKVQAKERSQVQGTVHP
jgi:uncharacterized membrane protein